MNDSINDSQGFFGAWSRADVSFAEFYRTLNRRNPLIKTLSLIAEGREKLGQGQGKVEASRSVLARDFLMHAELLRIRGQLDRNLQNGSDSECREAYEKLLAACVRYEPLLEEMEAIAEAEGQWYSQSRQNSRRSGSERKHRPRLGRQRLQARYVAAGLVAILTVFATARTVIVRSGSGNPLYDATSTSIDLLVGLVAVPINVAITLGLGRFFGSLIERRRRRQVS